MLRFKSWKFLFCSVMVGWLYEIEQQSIVVAYEVTEESSTFILNDEEEFSSRSSDLFSSQTTQQTQLTAEPLDLNELLGSWISIVNLDGTALKSGNENWRIGPMESRNLHLLSTGRYSDCSFVVGEENDTQIFRVHKLLLQRASPVFETLFNLTSDNKEQHFRISDITPAIFKILLEYMYTGQLCVLNYDDACSLLHLSLRFQIPDITLQCRAYLWSHLYPSNVWRGLECARTVNDTVLMETALQVTQRRTEDVLKDPQFTKIPQTTLITFVSQENLNINSEIKLFESILNWAKSEIKRQNLPENSNSYRTVLGNTLKQIRFLTLSASEFLNIQFNSKLLTCSESLSIISNLIAPGKINISETLSTNTNTRQINANSKKVINFNVINAKLNMCPLNNTKIYIKNSIYTLNTASAYTSKVIIYPTVKRIHGIQIPTQIHDNGSYYAEDVTVYILSHDKKIINFIRYQATVKYNSYITIGFKEKVSVPGCARNQYFCYSIVIDFHTSGTYPSTYLPYNGARFINVSQRSYLLGIKPFTWTWYFNYTDFIYSMFTDYNSV